MKRSSKELITRPKGDMPGLEHYVTMAEMDAAYEALLKDIEDLRRSIENWEAQKNHIYCRCVTLLQEGKNGQKSQENNKKNQGGPT